MKNRGLIFFQDGKIAVTVMLALAVMVFILMEACLPDKARAASDHKTDFSVFIGQWVRPDGGYVIQVREINADGTAGVSYLNPSVIHVAEAKVSVQKGLMKLYIRLEDKGYPGSTYTLYYYAEKDALAGFYYQAEMGKTFEVVFLRKKVE